MANLTREELTRRLESADRVRNILRRATLELRACGELALAGRARNGDHARRPDGSDHRRPAGR